MKEIMAKINAAYKNDYIKIFTVFLVFFVYFSLMYFSVDKMISTDDHFFHIRFAETIKSQGIEAFKDFHWIYFSKMSIDQTYFVYYNFLFYIFLLPFTYISPLFLGIKLYAVVFASIYFTILYSFLLKLKEKYAFFWVIILLALFNYGSVSRFLLTRPYAFAPALLILELYFLYRKKYLGVFAISFLYIFWHSATFFFPAIVAIAYSMFDAFYNDNKLNWKIVISSILGTILSLFVLDLFAPGFYYYMKDIIIKTYTDTIIGKKVGIAEGGELYGVDFMNYIKTSSLIVVLFAVAIVFEIFRYLQERKDGIITTDELEHAKRPLKGTLFFLSIGFFLGIFLSQRNGDFFVFFSAAYIVMSFNYFIEFIKIDAVLIKKSLIYGIVIAFTFLFASNSLFIYDQIASASPYNSVEGAANWLKDNAPQKSVVFNASWNWFPTLFYYNPNNYYVAGIEPRFLYDYNPKLYWTWWNISNYGFLCQEEQCEDVRMEQKNMLGNDEKRKIWYRQEGDLVAATIKKSFQSNYIVTSQSLKAFNELMDNNDNFEKVYTDNIYNTYLVYKVK